MVIGFDGSRAFVQGRTGTENYSCQLLKALAKIDQVNLYKVYIRPDTVILRMKSEGSLANARPSNNGSTLFTIGLRDSSLIVQNDNRVIRNDKYGWPGNFQFKEINWPRLWTQGGLAAQTFKDKLDVLFVPAHTLPLVKKPGLKTVVTVHDLGSEYLPSMHQLKQRLYLGFMQKVQLKTATKIIAVSKATKEDLIKKVGIDPKKISVVYEGYNQDLFKPVKNDLLLNTLIHYNLKPKTYFLFVGTVQPRKNLTKLIQSFNQFCHPEESSTKDLSRMRVASNNGSTLFTTGLRDSSLIAQNDKKETNNGRLKLVIAGSKGWLSNEIYKLPKKLGIEDKVKFLGYVPDQDLPALYSGALGLTFPSLFEGFGLPILEAQACGCPVLTSNLSSMPEVAGEGAIYVNPYSIDDIVEGMGKVQSSIPRFRSGQEFKVQSVEAGLENVKKFSWEKCARETLEVLESL